MVTIVNIKVFHKLNIKAHESEVCVQISPEMRFFSHVYGFIYSIMSSFPKKDQKKKVEEND